MTKKMNRGMCVGVFAALLAGACGVGWAQEAGADMGDGPGSRVRVAGKRPMTFADLQRMKRVGDPQISPSGRWAMFSVVDVDLEKNTKVSHLWVVQLGGGGGREADSSAALRNEKQKDSSERQVTFWKEGESGGRFSPDGKQVLFVATDGANNPSGLSQIFLAPWDEATGTLGTPRRLTNVSTEADGAIWSPDSQRILFVSRVYPGCSDEPAWMEEDNCDKKQDDAAAANPVKAQIWTHLLYRHWDHYVGPKRSHVLVVSATDGNAVRDLTPRREIGDSEAPTFSLGGPMGYAWAPDSKEIAFVTNVDPVPAASTNNDVFTLRLDDSAARPVKISTSLGSDDGPAYSPDGNWLAFRSQARAGYESDRFDLVVMDRSSRRIDHVLPRMTNSKSEPVKDNWVDEFAWAPDSKSIAIAGPDRGREVVQVNPLPVRGSLTPPGAWTGEDGEFGSLVFTKAGTIIATQMFVNRPPEIVILTHTLTGAQGGDIFFSKTDVRSLTHLNDALVEQLDLSKLESFWFGGAEDTQVEGFIVKPPKFDSARKYPLKFLIHGGPQGAWGDAWSYRWNPELMAANGYVVVMVNPRGSTGYGQAFIDGVNGDWGGKAYVDLMKGLDYAEQHYPFIDKSRECALGASYGGFMADWILTHTERFACIVTHDGMFNPQSAYGDTEELWFNEWEFRTPGSTAPGQPWRYAAGPIANDPFRKWSPMLSIQNAKTPTLVIHSQRDYRLDVSEGFQLFTALQRLNVPSKMLYFPDEGHWILKPQNSKLWYETVGDWCDRWTKTNAYALNLPYAAPPAPAPAAAAAAAPAKAEAKVATAPKGTAKVPSVPEVVAKPHVVQPVTTPTAVAPGVAARGQSMPEPETVTTTEHASFAIAISVPQDEVRVGSDVPVKIALRNVSNQKIVFGHRPGANNPEFSFEIAVKNAKGKVMEETAYGREASDARRRQEEDRTVEYVQPGGSAAQTAHIAKLVSLSRPGWYTVRVSRKDSVSGDVVRSNEVKFAVVP